MCELFGISAKKEVEANLYLKELQQHSVNHPHGWGIAIFEEGSLNIEKEPICALKSAYLKERLKEPIVVHNMIGHIRWATKGNESFQNTHPFVKKDKFDRRWILAHNGTIFDGPILDPYVFEQKGQTDSERILYGWIDRMNSQEELSEVDRFCLMDDYVYELSNRNKLNLLIFDGEYLYVHTNYKDSLFQKQVDKGVIFATKPLDNKNWQNVPFCQLLVYRNGDLVFQGKNVTKEYIESKEDLEFLYLDSSFL